MRAECAIDRALDGADRQVISTSAPIVRYSASFFSMRALSCAP